jgi:hypothetical protein
MSAYPFSRWVAGGALLVVLAGGSSIALASAGGGAAVKPKCTIAGVRYVGSTSQKQQVCFTLSTDGKKLREYAYNFRDDCDSSGTTRITNPRRSFLAVLAANAPSPTITTPFPRPSRGWRAAGRRAARSGTASISSAAPATPAPCAGPRIGPTDRTPGAATGRRGESRRDGSERFLSPPRVRGQTRLRSSGQADPRRP